MRETWKFISDTNWTFKWGRAWVVFVFLPRKNSWCIVWFCVGSLGKFRGKSLVGNLMKKKQEKWNDIICAIIFVGRSTSENTSIDYGKLIGLITNWMDFIHHSWSFWLIFHLVSFKWDFQNLMNVLSTNLEFYLGISLLINQLVQWKLTRIEFDRYKGRYVEFQLCY